METTYSSYYGGWLSNKPRSSTGSSSITMVPKIALVACLMFNAGTGAYADDHVRLRHNTQHGSFVCGPELFYSSETAYTRNAAEDVARVRDVFNPAISDLAKCFQVSRQTIYNWLNGEQLTPEHSEKLEDLAIAADMFAESGIPATGSLIKRKLHNGKTLFEVVRDGGSARDAVQMLIQITTRETSQRELLAARFAGRKAIQNNADVDFMAANDGV